MRSVELAAQVNHTVMRRFHVRLSVGDLPANIAFCSRPFGADAGPFISPPARPLPEPALARAWCEPRTARRTRAGSAHFGA